MQKTLSILLGLCWAMGLVIVGLWTWQRGPVLTKYFHSTRPPVMLWAARSAAVALIAAGEALLALLVIGNLWRRDRLTATIGWSASVLFIAGAAGAIFLGALGR